MAAAAALALIGAAVAAAASRVTSPDGTFEVALDGWVKPARLAAAGATPISLHLGSEVISADGAEPPDMRELTLEADRDVSLDVSGLPVCRMLGMPVSPPPWGSCREGIVGQGRMTILYSAPEGEPTPVTSKLVVYNGGVKGRTTNFWVRTYLPVPKPNVSLARMKVKRVNKGRYGLEVKVSIPTLAARFGTLLSFDLTLGRKILSASCPDAHLSVRGSTLLEGSGGMVELPFSATRGCA
ncbi:MAG TPA: hypothetical protein VK480_11640 [Solirubrobacterales bacterium]|nr:hypothetical protein [Solirubrobacterales bacterium]